MKDKRLFILMIIYIFSFSSFDLVLAFFPKILLDMYINNESYRMIIGCMIVFLLTGCTLGFVNSIIRENATARIGYLRIDYLAEAFNKIITSDYKNMEDPTFFNKYDSAFDACSNTESGIEKVYGILFELPAMTVKMILVSYVVCCFSPIILLVTIVHTIFSFKLKKKSASYKYMYREQFSKINRKKRYFNNVTQDFQYGKDIRLYSFKDLLNQKYFSEILQYKKLYEKVRNKEFKLNLFGCTTRIVSDVTVYSVLILSSLRDLSIANITLYFIVVGMLVLTANTLIVNISDIYGEGLYISDYFDFINADLCKKGGKNVVLDTKNTGIKIKKLRFKYPNTNKYVLNNLDLCIMPGEKIALVGDNGVGKSTLIKILVGLFRDFEGDIYIGDKSIREISTKSLFSLFSVVFQDISLLAYTVRENITGSGEYYDEKRVWDVVEKVGLKNKILKTDQGLEQQIHKYFDEKGLEFSGGESQKFAIARAIYKNASIFILDEPTASLDALMEKSIYEKLGELTNGKTTIFISHRLASTKFCDRIVLIGSDGVLEQGTHKELMNKKGKYFEMFSMQGKYYKEKDNE